jgi:hypothetical protein
MTSNYLLQLKTPNSGTFVMMLKYNAERELVAVELREFELSMNEQQRQWLWDFIPKHEAGLKHLPPKKTRVTKIENDLSFESWWDLYDYKVGNKKRAKDHYEKLDDHTKALVFQKTKEYNYFMANVSFDKVFPERFLAQKRYENEYKVRR